MENNISNETIQTILSKSEEYRYQLLGRLKSDCLYYLNYGNRNPKNLWGLSESYHIEYMKLLWNSFPEDGKPEWLTWQNILEFESNIISK